MRRARRDFSARVEIEQLDRHLLDGGARLVALRLPPLSAKRVEARRRRVRGEIVGGAIAAPFMGHIADLHSMRTGFVVPLVCFVFVALYGLSWARLSRHDSLPVTKV